VSLTYHDCLRSCQLYSSERGMQLVYCSWYSTFGLIPGQWYLVRASPRCWTATVRTTAITRGTQMLSIGVLLSSDGWWIKYIKWIFNVEYFQFTLGLSGCDPIIGPGESAVLGCYFDALSGESLCYKVCFVQMHGAVGVRSVLTNEP
jgi:hypothetical protein